jgi:hypothetical protein
LKIVGAETKRILITVKAYPNPSDSMKYSETVCCAGIDLSNFQWIRLYPVPFRDLEENKKFPKYSIIEAVCGKSDDKRPESYRIREDSISVIEHLDTRNHWARRKSIVFRLPIKSQCRAIIDQKELNSSFAMIKPRNITFSSERKTKSDSQKRSRHYDQGSLYTKWKAPIEEIPYHFYYHFYCCSESSCPGHKLPIVDWEINEAYRKYRKRYVDEQIVLNKLEERWLNIADVSRCDVRFFVGNQLRFHNNFMVLGVFWPPRI